MRLLKRRMEQKNGVQHTLLQSGIVMKIEESQKGLPEIISEDTFIEFLCLSDETMPGDIMDSEFENEDLDDDSLMID